MSSLDRIRGIQEMLERRLERLDEAERVIANEFAQMRRELRAIREQQAEEAKDAARWRVQVEIDAAYKYQSRWVPAYDVYPKMWGTYTRAECCDAVIAAKGGA